MLTLLLANWRMVALAALLAANAATVALWRHAANHLDDLRAEVRASERVALAEKRAAEAHQTQVLQEVTDAWVSALPGVRADAVRRYLARRVQQQPAAVGHLPGQAQSAPATDGAAEECRPDERLIAACAEDAFKVILWQRWAVKNGIEAE